MEEHREQVHEVVEVYRRPEPQEVVEVYSRPMPGMKQKPDPAPQKRRRHRKGLLIFLSCVAALVAVTVLLKLLIPTVEEYVPDPFEKYAGEVRVPQWTEITIPTVPVGQGGALELVRQQGETLSAQQVYQRVNPSVVTVLSKQGERSAMGTGVIFTTDGYILTNHHILDGGEACAVVLDTGYTYEAFYVAGDPANDLAVLKVQDTELPAAEFGDSDQLVVGDPVYAIGNPLGVELRGTLTDGIVSAINRDVWVDDHYMTLIQTNAALNSGNSGGPLINEAGQVVGINVIKMTSRYSTVEGLGFAIPSASMERIVNDLLTFGEVKPEPLLGITVITAAEEVEPGVWGLMVDDLTPGGVGETAGVQVGDYLLLADGEELHTSADLLRVRRHHYVGETMELVVWRNGTQLTFTLNLNQSVTD